MTIFHDDAPRIAGTVITITTLAYLSFGLRVYTRITKGSWGIEDWLMTVAAFPFAVLAIACLISSFMGIGVHAYRFKEPGNEKYYELGLFWFFLFEVFYCVAIIPIKLSIGFMLVRIAQNKKAYIWSQYLTMGMFTTMNLIAAFYIIFQCNPVSAAWDAILIAEGGHCNDPKILADIYYATTAVNIFTDWFTAFMPIPLLWNVKLNRNAKISVVAILSLGIFASMSACIRLKYTVNLYGNQGDYLYGLGNIVLWGYAENGIGMLVGNLATLRPLFRRMFNLGGSDKSNTPAAGRASAGSAFPNAFRRTYKPFDTSYELGTVKVGANSRDPNITTQIYWEDRKHSSVASDSESQKQIIEKTRGPHEIVVSRQINISHH